MAMNVGDDHVILARGLVKMVAVLEKLQRRCPGIKIIWLNQPPTIDFIRYKKEFYVRPFTVHSEKIHRYNQFLREHLKYLLIFNFDRDKVDVQNLFTLYKGMQQMSFRSGILQITW